MLLEYTPTWKCMARNLLLCHLLAIETVGKSTQIFSSTWRNMTFVSLRSFILKVCWAVYWQKTGYTHMNWAMYSLATFCPELRHPFLPRCSEICKLNNMNSAIRFSDIFSTYLFALLALVKMNSSGPSVKAAVKIGSERQLGQLGRKWWRSINQSSWQHVDRWYGTKRDCTPT